jgi:hypothetical protein
VSKRNELQRYVNAEDFAVTTVEVCPDDIAGVEYHLIRIRSALAKQLWSRGFFIGVSILDTLLFQVVKETDVDDPIERVLELISDYGLHKPGFVLYPIHSLGILAYGLFQTFTGAQVRLVLTEAGIAIGPQSNSKQNLFNFLDSASAEIGIRGSVRRDLVEHYMRSRPLKWITNNPLLMVKTSVFSDGYYENQHLLMGRLRTATTFIHMLSALGNAQDPDVQAKYFSSSMVNNWQTLDIKHYLVFETPVRRRKYLDTICIPINVSGSELADLSDLAVEVDPREWRKRFLLSGRVHVALEAVESGFLKHSLGAMKSDHSGRLYRKLLNSLTYFKRSFRARAMMEDDIVNLAIAFESLLLDQKVDDIRGALKRRLRTTLRGVRGTRSYQKDLVELYQIRNEIVHRGATDNSPNLRRCRRAYIFAFLSVVESLITNKGNVRTHRPIAELLGET